VYQLKGEREITTIHSETMGPYYADTEVDPEKLLTILNMILSQL